MILPALVLVLVIIGVPKVAAEAPAWVVDASRSRLSFTTTQAGSPFEGEFTRFNADIHFAPENLATSRVTVEIDMASVETRNRERDETVRSQEWFAVGTYPQARFATTAIRRIGDDRYEAAASLTIRGIARSVMLPFTLMRDGGEAHAAGELTIDRTDYGVGQGQWASGDMVGREVTIRFDLWANRKP